MKTITRKHGVISKFEAMLTDVQMYSRIMVEVFEQPLAIWEELRSAATALLLLVLMGTDSDESYEIFLRRFMEFRDPLDGGKLITPTRYAW